MCRLYCILYQPTIEWHRVASSWGFSINPPPCLFSAQLMHFLLAVCSERNKKKTPDEILGAAIRTYCSRLHRKIFIGWRQKFIRDLLANKWDTAPHSFKCSWRYHLLQHFDVHWCHLYANPNNGGGKIEHEDRSALVSSVKVSQNHFLLLKLEWYGISTSTNAILSKSLNFSFLIYQQNSRRRLTQ